MTSCGHCGFVGELEQVGKHARASSQLQHDEQYGEISIDTMWATFRCPECDLPTLASYVWIDEFFETEDDVDWVRLWPTHDSDDDLPANVRAAHTLAKKGRAVDPAFYAVGARRTLEAICDDQGFTAGSLHARLEQLAQSGALTPELADLTISLKNIGNLGAHEGLGEVATEDMPAIADLMEALLEFLYRAPAKLDLVRKSFAARGINL